MMSDGIGERTSQSLVRLSVTFTAGVLTPRFFGGLCSRSAEGLGRSALLLATALGLVAVLEIIRRSRARKAQRLMAAVDAYAERQIGKAHLTQ